MPMSSHGVGVRRESSAQRMARVEQKEVVVSVPRTPRGLATPLTRRAAVAMGLTLAGGALATASARPVFATPSRQATPVATAPIDDAAAIVAIARDIMDKQDVKAVILRVLID